MRNNPGFNCLNAQMSVRSLEPNLSITLRKGVIVMSSKASKAKHPHKPDGEHAGHAAAKAKVAEPLPPTVWVEEMMESLTGAQKRWIDLASEQNALFLKAIAEGVNFYKSAPTPALADWAKQGVEGIVEGQRRWADAASMQSTQFDFSEVRRTASDVTGKGLEAFVKARTQWLDFVVEQNAMTLKAMQRQSRPG